MLGIIELRQFCVLQTTHLECIVILSNKFLNFGG